MSTPLRTYPLPVISKPLRDFTSAEYQALKNCDLQFSSPWSERQWDEAREKTYYYVVAIKKENALIAFSLWSSIAGQGHLLKIHVELPFRRQGLAKKMMTLFEMPDVHDSYYLEVSASNHGAIKLYERMNYHKQRQIKGFYQSGEDAWTMLKVNKI